ncbi:hypothetical protein ES705_21965 [subsurface metagenome]
MNKPKTFWSYWDLKKNPFGNIESANEVFEGNEMMRAMDHLEEAIEEGGIYSITGERGIGKTTVKNEMIQYLRDDPKRFAYSVLESMDMSLVRMTTIHAAIIMDLSNETPKGFAEHRGRQVRRILGELTASGKSVVLIIDEAQNMRFPTMESLKMLTEMRWALLTKRLITILLFGQPILDARLSRDEGLRLRVTPFRMKGLTTDEVLQYIDLRCRAAGGNMADIFKDEALAYIAEHQHSPLHINGICSQCMRAAKSAGEGKVTLEMIYASGGIRTPRTVLRENSISIHKFSKLTNLGHRTVEKLLDGDDSGVSEDQKRKFHGGMLQITRSDETTENLKAKAG